MSSASAIGVDMGGTKIALARYDAATLTLQAQEQMPTPTEKGFTRALDLAIERMQLLREKDTKAIGIGIPGLVRFSDGMLLKAPNIPQSDNIAVRDIVSSQLKLPVWVENDVHCFALAEAVSGAGRGEHTVVGITMGTGVGGGIVIEGELFRGAHGCAGEIGHMLLMPGKPPEGSQHQRGEVEQFLSGSAMRGRCEEAKRPEEYLEGEVCAFLRPDLFREAAWLCTNLSHLLDPSVIVFGGSMGRALAEHIPDIHREMQKWMLPDTVTPKLAKAVLDDAAMRGAAMLAAKLVKM